MSLSGVDISLISDITDDDYYGRDMRLYVGFFDADHQLIADPENYWSGFIDSASITIRDNEAIIEVTGEHLLSRAQRPRVCRYTNEDQQALHSGDRFFDQVWYNQDKKLKWGGKKVIPPGAYIPNVPGQGGGGDTSSPLP